MSGNCGLLSSIKTGIIAVMKKYTEPTPDDYVNIAQKVRSGEYFRESRAMYDGLVNDPMSERYFYVFVTSVALLTMLVAFYAAQSLYPLTRVLPFIYASNDVVEDVPRIIRLKQNKFQSPSEAVLFFLAGNFVKQYEEYDIALIERNLNGLRQSSSPELFARYQIYMQPTNPASPVVQYQRHSTRSVNIISVNNVPGDKPQLEIVYDATVVRSTTQKTTRYIAQLRYQYSGIVFDDKTGKVGPFSFIVTDYSSKLAQGKS